MEASFYFSAFVLAMCGIHVTWTASEKLEDWWQKRVPPPKRQVAEKSGHAPQRSDWYAFFHCADLVGKDPAREIASPAIPGRKAPERKTSRPPRINAR